mmetsp:Transcript_121237/g.377411  ORF Transcript_121237/g.377411 Transcript_121237/m.377411 type:complete len:366 (+) Transcript_121237:141-1238(+)
MLDGSLRTTLRFAAACPLPCSKGRPPTSGIATRPVSSGPPALCCSPPVWPSSTLVMQRPFLHCRDLLRILPFSTMTSVEVDSLVTSWSLRTATRVPCEASPASASRPRWASRPAGGSRGGGPALVAAEAVAAAEGPWLSSLCPASEFPPSSCPFVSGRACAASGRPSSSISGCWGSASPPASSSSGLAGAVECDLDRALKISSRTSRKPSRPMLFSTVRMLAAMPRTASVRCCRSPPSLWCRRCPGGGGTSCSWRGPSELCSEEPALRASRLPPGATPTSVRSTQCPSLQRRVLVTVGPWLSRRTTVSSVDSARPGRASPKLGGASSGPAGASGASSGSMMKPPSDEGPQAGVGISSKVGCTCRA